MQVLAIIPARGGSKGLPNKNIAQICGMPLIAWSILVAQEARSVNRIVVTTDSKEIADIAIKYGAEVPFMRPSELAQDDTPGILPIINTLDWLFDNEQYQPDYVLDLQPTSPLRTSQDIEKAMGIMLEKNADSIISVTPVDKHPYWMKRVDETGRITEFIDSKAHAENRQDLPPVYLVNGAIFIAKREILLRHKDWYTDKTFSYIMPKERSVDIDYIWDLNMAELLLKKIQKKEIMK